MANKVAWYHHWDWKSIWGSLTIVVLILVVVGWLYLPEFMRNRQLSKLKGETIGVIISIKENETIRHSLEGSRTAVDSYEVFYQYNTGTRILSGSDWLWGSTKNYQALKETMNKDRKVNVRFDIRKPSRSMLDLRKK